LLQTRAQRAEARYMARASAASADVLSSLLADIGASGKPLSPVQLLERGRELVDKNYAGDAALQSELLVSLAVRYQLINRPDRELELRALGEQAARRAGDGNLLASALCAGVSADIDAGRAAVAQVRVDEARRVIAAMKGEPRLLVSHVCLNAEADLATDRLDTAEAVRLSRQAVKLFEDADERDGNPYLVALGNLAYHHERAGQLVPAFDIMVKLGAAMDTSGRTTTRDRLTAMLNEGHLRFYFGEVAQAFALFREAVQRAQGLDLSVPAADAGLARAYGVGLMHMGRDAEALRWLSYARDRGRAGGDLFIELEAIHYLAQAHVRAGRPDEAAAALDLREATRVAAPTPPPAPALAIARVRAQIALLRGEVALARQIMRAQLETVDPPGVRGDRNLLAKLPIAAQAAWAAGALDEARRHADAYLQCALRVARLPEQSAHVGRAWALLGEVQQRQGLPREARASRQLALPILAAALGVQHPETQDMQALLTVRP
jgi:tetratricopeptide (TPR) repeat protein